MKKRLLVLAALFILSGSVASGAVRLQLVLDAQKTLPSVPVGLTITALNESDSPATLHGILWMRLDRGDGHPVLLPASPASDGPDGVGLAESARSIAPHSSRTICSVKPDLISPVCHG